MLKKFSRVERQQILHIYTVRNVDWAFLTNLLNLWLPRVINFVEDGWLSNFLSEDVDVHDVSADILRNELHVEQPIVVG